MILRLFLLSSLIAFTIPAYAAGSVCPLLPTQPTAEMVQAVSSNARNHGFLWRISKNEHTSYLYGTIHLGKLEWIVPGQTVMDALRSSDTLALELDMLDVEIKARMVKGMAALRSAPIPEALVKRMQQQAEVMCIPYDALDKLPPEFQAETLTMMVGRWDGLYTSYAVDSVLAGIGHGTKKGVVSLETPELQLQLLRMKDSGETISFVEDSLDELETGRARSLLKRIAKIWADADYADMSHFNEWCDCLNTASEREMMKRALDDRNPNLAERIDVLHKSGKRVFAAVGSLHMFGTLGLPTLMEKRGYKVEQVELNTK